MLVELDENVSSLHEEYRSRQLFQEALECALKDCAPVTIDKIRIELGSSVGDNFLGLIYRVKVYFYRQLCNNEISALETLSFIVKGIPDTEPNKFLHIANVYLKEKLCYNEILPRMEVLGSEDERFGAKLYYARKAPISTLVFEDLNSLNYIMASRVSGLDETHCCVVLRKLGKFHAMSMILSKNNAELMRCFHSGMISKAMLKPDTMPLQYFEATFTVLESEVSKWPGYEQIAEKLRNYQLNFRENLLRSTEKLSNDVCVLNHGDLWVNNVLFHYDSNRQPNDVYFIDFQMSMWASLGLDLNYFLNTSVPLQVLQTRRQHLLHVYYGALRDNLEAHDYATVPTFAQVQQEVRKREAYGFFAAYGVFPMIAMDKNDSAENSLENLTNADFALRRIRKMFSSNKVQNMLKYSLKRFDELRVLDIEC